MNSIRIPDDFLYEYLQGGGLSGRMALLAGRSLSTPESLERALDLSLELELLMATTPLPDSLQDRLLRSLGGLGSRLVIQARGQGCGPSAKVLGVTFTRAEALDLVRSGWARAWSPTALLAGNFLSPALHRSLAASAELEVVVVVTDNPDQDHEKFLVEPAEFMPDGSVVPLDTGSLQAALDSAEDSLLRGLPEAAAAVEKLASWTRYAFGRAYNSWNLPEEAFEFMNLLLPACHRPASAPLDPRDTKLAVGMPSGLPDRIIELWHLALWATSLQLALPPAPELGYQPEAGGILAQQLTGFAAAPGRATGRSARSPGSRGEVIICEQLSIPLMMADPVAALERRGSRLGLGALLARDAGIPCTSGIGELPTLPDNVPVMVDGHLGLATIDRGR